VEAIAALRPDLVLMAASSHAAVRLRALGFKVVRAEPKAVPDMRRVILHAGPGAAGRRRRAAPAQHRRGREGGRRVAAGAHAARACTSRSPGAVCGRARQLHRRTECAGPGQRDRPGLGPFPRINPEYVVRAAPDIIMASRASLQDMARRPGWSALAALRGGRVCAFDAASATSWYGRARACPRPRA
jgi:iron complex transport system substrate-binding protein